MVGTRSHRNSRDARRIDSEKIHQQELKQLPAQSVFLRDSQVPLPSKIVLAGCSCTKREAWHCCWECQYERGYNFAYSLTRNQHDAEDVLHEAFLRCRFFFRCKHGIACYECRICRRERWPLGECSHRRRCCDCLLCDRDCEVDCWPYLKVIIQQAAFDFRQKESRRRKLISSVSPDSISCCDAGCNCLCCDCITCCDLRYAVCRLQEDYRTIIVLLYWYKLTLDEIAIRLRKTLSYIRKKHLRAIKILRLELAGHEFKQRCCCCCCCLCVIAHSWSNFFDGL